MNTVVYILKKLLLIVAVIKLIHEIFRDFTKKEYNLKSFIVSVRQN